MSKFTGYGKGWQEPLATTESERRKQKLREPATKDDYRAAFATVGLVIMGALVLTPLAIWLLL